MTTSIRNGILSASTCLLFAATTIQAAAPSVSYGGAPYREQELSLDLFGSAAIGQSTFDHLSRSRISHDSRLGVGAGLNYFFTRNLGAGIEAGTESTGHYLVDRVSASFIARFPLGDSGFAPYALVGGGRQFDPTELWFAHGGGGIEYRFTPNVGIFTDARFVLTERTSNYGLFRLGMRFAF